MPKIREIRNTTFASEAGLPPARRASGSDFDTSDPSAGRGLMAAAQGIGAMMARVKEDEERAEVSDVHARLATARAEWTVKFQERAMAAQPGDTTFAQTFGTELSDYLSKGEENLSTKAGIAAYRRGSADMSAHFLAQAGVHQAKAIGDKARSDYDVLVNSTALSLYNDPSQFAGALEATRQALYDPAGTYARIGAERDKLFIGARERLAASALQGLMRTDPQQALVFLRTGTGPAEAIDISARNGLETDALAAIERGRAGLDKQVEVGRQQLLSDLTIGIDRGTKGYADVEGAYARGVIEPAERTRLIKQLDDKRKTDAEAAAGIARVSAALAGGAPLDFRSTDDKKALDTHFTLTAQSWQNLAPAEVVDRAIAYTSQVGIAPKPMQGMIRGFLRSGNAEQALIAADAVKRLRNANPQILNDFNDEDLRLANVIGALTDSGVPPARALTMAQEQMKVPKHEQDVRGEEYDTLRGADRTARLAADRTWIEGRKNSFWSRDPDVDPVMRSDFDTIARQEFIRTGNLEAARTFALDQVDRVWGRSSVAGADRYMKFAPEKFYGVPSKSQADNAAWMREQLVADISRDALQDPNNPITADKLILIPNPTKTAPDGRPLYIVGFMGSDGILRDIAGPGGRPRSWKPEWTTSAQAKREAEAQRLSVENARAQREENQRQRDLRTMPEAIEPAIPMP